MKKETEVKEKRITHSDRILAYLQDKGHITSWQAIREFGITRLSAVIYNLRHDGYNIQSESVSRKNRYGDKVTFAKYVLVNE